MNKQVNSWLPFILLTLVGICIFLTEKSDGGFVPGGFYSGVSVHGLTLSKNLMNSEHPLFIFAGRELQDGKIVYDAYNRFPVFPFLLTGLIINPFEYDLSLQIYLARQLMNIFFFLSIIVAFKLVTELVKNRYLAISVVLITFSSYYMLTYNNLIFNDIPALLGFVLALYAVIKSQQEKLKIPHILFYSIFPISMGWQPYAVYGTWFLIDTLALVLSAEKTSLRVRLFNIFRQPSFIITLLAITWGVIILGMQLLNEWRIVGGSFTDLPSVSSALWRSGLSSAAGHTQFIWLFDWLNYLPAQAQAITVMLIPFWPVFQVDPGINASIFVVISLMIYALLRYLKDRSLVNKVHLILIFSGLPWAIVMKQFVAMHEFQSIFYIGLTVSVYVKLLSRINLQAWNLLAINITVAFLIAVSLTNYYKTPHTGMNLLADQFKPISNQLPENSKVFFDGDRKQMKGFSRYAIDLFLTGCLFTEQDQAEYVISKDPDFGGEKLTNNSEFNLFKVSVSTSTFQK